MFALRGIAVSLSALVLVYCALSLAVAWWWSRLELFIKKYPVRHAADLFFGLRILPLLAACAVTAAFTIPSFLLLEPRSIDEPIGIPLALGVCGILLALFGMANATLALRGASRKIAEWLNNASVVEDRGPVPVLRISGVMPALAAVGIFRPRVLLSGAAEFVLSGKELKPALRHEMVHVRRRDNLRKLVLRMVAFPGMSGLETAWLTATEMAADDAAVSTCGEALDLAAALIKLSRLSPLQPQAELTTSLVHSPMASVNARVERLVEWSEDRRVPAQRYSAWYALGAGVAMVAVCGVTYSHLLARVHAATEWLIR